MLSELTAAQIAEWEAFYELEPFGPLRDDLRAGLTAAAIANRIPRFSQGGKALRPEDLFPTLRSGTRQQSREQLQRAMAGIAVAFGGQVVRAADLKREQGRS